MRRCWPLHEAKNKFSEVVHRAETEGPQVVTVRGREAVVVLSAKDYGRLAGQEESLLDFFRRSPLWASGIEFERVDDYGRDIDLGD